MTPRWPLLKHVPAIVQISYGGTTGRIVDAEGSLYGWVSAAGGVLFGHVHDGAP